MDQINWCLDKRKGIEMVEPNDNLREAYLLKADEALEVLRIAKIKDWQLTTVYYAMYHGLYCILMKMGIKCEIHTCTIEFAKSFLKSHFTSEDFVLLEKAFTARNDAQYYVNRKIKDEDYQLILKKAPAFLVKCKNTIIEQKEIKAIRENLQERRKALIASANKS